MKLRPKKNLTNPRVLECLANVLSYTEDSRELTYVLEGGKVRAFVLETCIGFLLYRQWLSQQRSPSGFCTNLPTSANQWKENTLRREKVEALVEAALP